MADYNRNQRRSNRFSNQDWNNEGRNRNRRSDYDDRYSRNEYRGYGDANRDYEMENDAWKYGRTDYNSGDMGYASRYGRGYEGDKGYSSRDRSYGYEGGGYDRGEHQLYDRDYEGSTRRGYSGMGTRLGASNYGSYGDRDRNYDWRTQNQNRGYGGYSGSNYGGNYGPSNYDRDEDRNWWDKTTDEVSSWFGDEDAERRRNRDRMMNHRGRGPKNYTRSDDRIREDINDKLSDDPFVDATEIEVTVSNGEVTLTGTVDERSTKRRAEDIAEDVSGVKNVENRIRVTSMAGMEMTSAVSNTGTGARSETGATSTQSERAKNRRDFVTG